MKRDPIVEIESSIVRELLDAIASDDIRLETQRMASLALRLRRWATRLLVVAVCLLLGLLILGVVVSAGYADIAQLGTGALVAAVAIEGFAIVAVLLETIAGAIQLFRHAKSMVRRYHDDFCSDRVLASKLGAFSNAEVKLCEQWLEQRAKRIDRKLVWFFGGGDKVALVALLIAAGTIWKNFGTSLLDPRQTLILLGCALIAGLSFGGLALARERDRLLRAREILLLVLTIEGPPDEVRTSSPN